MRDAGAFLCLPFPAGDNEVTSYNVFGFFLSHPPPSTFCCPLSVFSPLGHRHSCSRLPAGMAGVSGAWPGAETSLCLMGGGMQPPGSLGTTFLHVYSLDGCPSCCPWSRQAVLAALALSPGAFMLKHFLSFLRQTKAVFLLQTSAEQTGRGRERG